MAHNKFRTKVEYPLDKEDTVLKVKWFTFRIITFNSYLLIDPSFLKFISGFKYFEYKKLVNKFVETRITKENKRMNMIHFKDR